MNVITIENYPLYTSINSVTESVFLPLFSLIKSNKEQPPHHHLYLSLFILYNTDNIKNI